MVFLYWSCLIAACSLIAFFCDVPLGPLLGESLLSTSLMAPGEFPRCVVPLFIQEEESAASASFSLKVAWLTASARE